jgi:two-component system, sensor histidine kinase YesM
MVSLSRRFAFLFALLIALPVIVVSVALSRLYLMALFVTLSAQTEATAEQVSRSIQGEVAGASFLAASLLHDTELRVLIDRYAAASGKARLDAYARLDEKVTTTLIYANRIGGIVFYLKDGRIIYFTNYPNLRSAEGIDRASFDQAKRARGEVYILDTLLSPTVNIGDRNIISVAVCPAVNPVVFPPDASDTTLDAILVMVRVPFFDDLGARAGPGGGDILIFGRNGRLLLSSLPSEAAAGFAPLAPMGYGPGSFRRVSAGGKVWLASSSSMDATGWTVVFLTDQAFIERSVTRYSWYLFPALGILALLSALFVETFLARIAGPIRGLIAEMERVGRGDYAAKASPSGIAELESLIQGFNSMVHEVRALTAAHEKEERERLAAELEALRYQINPHFVANTLNSIRLMARAAKADSIAAMSGDLMRVLADSYAGSSSLVELSRELDNVRSYIAIMKVRFGRRLAVSFDVSPESEGLLSLRMMLQPIVENSILHGFGGADEAIPRISAAGRGSIRIAARVEEGAFPPAEPPDPDIVALLGRRLVIEVADDGVGMDEARLAAVCEEEGSRNGLYRIGIANVRKRLELNFGPPFGLTIRSEPARGTTATFVLPAMRKAAPEGGATNA